MIFPDVSHHHPVIDFKAAKKHKVLITKATEGVTYVDPTLKRFIGGCEKNGIDYWLYSFVRKGKEKSQAAFLVKTCKGLIGKHFVGYILDIESGSAAIDVANAIEWLSKKSDKVMLYTGYQDYAKYKGVIAKRPKNCAWWEARYWKNDGRYYKGKNHDGVDLYQYTSAGTADGISGKCDMNITLKRDSWFQKASTYYAKCTGATLIEALKSIGVDSSFSNRKKIAKKNGIKLYMGTKTQNLKLYRLALSGKLVR